MGDFLTDVELAYYLQVPSVDPTTANLLIGMAEASVRSYCGWNITEETVTDGVVEPSDGRHIFLPTTHLTAVTNVTDTGTVYTPGAQFRWTVGGMLTRTYGWWSPTFGAVTATYTHGYAAGAPELLIVKQVVAAAVGRLLDRADQLSAVTVGGISETYATAPSVPAGLLYNEMAALGTFRVVGVV